MSAPSPDAMAAMRNDEPPLVETPSPRTHGGARAGAGRKSKGTTPRSRVNIPGSSKTSNAAIAPQGEDKIASHAMTAGACTSMTILIATILGGEDFAPGPNPIAGGANDQKILYNAYFDYAKAKDMVDLPPGVALAAAVLVYIAPRLGKPTARSRMGFIAGKIGGFFKHVFTRKKARANGAWVNPGDDGKREDHVGAASSA